MSLVWLIFEGAVGVSAASHTWALFILYTPFATFSINTFTTSEAILLASSGLLSVTDICIKSVSSTDETDILFFNELAVLSIFKFLITSSKTLSLFIKVLYVETNFWFNVKSLLVIVSCPSSVVVAD